MVPKIVSKEVKDLLVANVFNKNRSYGAEGQTLSVAQVTDESLARGPFLNQK
jgi:hypothetical protein